jgi:hypothetical protein
MIDYTPMHLICKTVGFNAASMHCRGSPKNKIIEQMG